MSVLSALTSMATSYDPDARSRARYGYLTGVMGDVALKKNMTNASREILQTMGSGKKLTGKDVLAIAHRNNIRTKQGLEALFVGLKQTGAMDKLAQQKAVGDIQLKGLQRQEKFETSPVPQGMLQQLFRQGAGGEAPMISPGETAVPGMEPGIPQPGFPGTFGDVGRLKSMGLLEGLLKKEYAGIPFYKETDAGDVITRMSRTPTEEAELGKWGTRGKFTPTKTPTVGLEEKASKDRRGKIKFWLGTLKKTAGFDLTTEDMLASPEDSVTKLDNIIRDPATSTLSKKAAQNTKKLIREELGLPATGDKATVGGATDYISRVLKDVSVEY